MGFTDRRKRRAKQKKAEPPAKKAEEAVTSKPEEAVTPKPQEVAAPEPEHIVKDAKEAEPQAPEPEAGQKQDLQDATLMGMGPAAETSRDDSSSTEPAAQAEPAVEQDHSDSPSGHPELAAEADIELVRSDAPPDSSEELTVKQIDLSQITQAGQAVDPAPTGPLSVAEAQGDAVAKQQPKPQLRVVGGEEEARDKGRSSRRQLPPPRPQQKPAAPSAEPPQQKPSPQTESSIRRLVNELLRPINEKLAELESQVESAVADTVGKDAVAILNRKIEDIGVMLENLVGKDGNRTEGIVTNHEDNTVNKAVEYMLSVSDPDFREFATSLGNDEELSFDTFEDLADDPGKITEYLASRNYSVARVSVSEMRRLIAENKADAVAVIANTRATYEDLPDDLKQIVDAQAEPLVEKAAELAEQGRPVAEAKKAFGYLSRFDKPSDEESEEDQVDRKQPSLEEFAEEYETEESTEPFEFLVYNPEYVRDWVSKILHKCLYGEINEDNFGEDAADAVSEVNEEVEYLLLLASNLVADNSAGDS